MFDSTLEVSGASVDGASVGSVFSTAVSWLTTSMVELSLLQDEAANPKATMIAMSGEKEHVTTSA